MPIERAGVFEPPFYLGRMATHLVARFNAQVERERLDDALATAMRIVGLGPRTLPFVPHWILRLGAARALRVDDRRSTSYASLRELISAMRYHFNVVLSMNHHLHDLRAVSTPVLLIGGSRSPYYLKQALVALRATLPYCECIELAGADHSSPWNEDLNGKPKLVASILVEYFATIQAGKTP